MEGEARKPGERRLQILQTLAAMLQEPQAEKITTAALAARSLCSEKSTGTRMSENPSIIGPLHALSAKRKSKRHPQLCPDRNHR